MTVAKEAFEILDGARSRINAERESVSAANASLSNTPLIPAAIAAGDRFAFAFSLGCLVGQVLWQYPRECMRAFYAGVGAGRATAKVMVAMKQAGMN
jgi:hypothetical protein